MKIITNTFSPFYDFARRQLGIAPKTVDEYLANGATATINGRTVTLTYPGNTTNGHAGIGHTAHATRWVNTFNARSVRAS